MQSAIWRTCLIAVYLVFVYVGVDEDGWRKMKLIVVIKCGMFRDRVDVVNPGLFHQQAIIQENL